VNAPVLLAVAIVLDAGREFALKASADRHARRAFARHWPAMPRILQSSGSTWFAMGGVLWLAEMLVWLAVLRTVALTVAFPVMALGYALAPALAVRWLGERLSLRQWAGVGCIVIGAGGIGWLGLG
jgi:undecaprenyl phosphate-alpha-L-ara4N flippase subunit ArnE